MIRIYDDRYDDDYFVNLNSVIFIKKINIDDEKESYPYAFRVNFSLEDQMTFWYETEEARDEMLGKILNA